VGKAFDLCFAISHFAAESGDRLPLPSSHDTNAVQDVTGPLGAALEVLKRVITFKFLLNDDRKQLLLCPGILLSHAIRAFTCPV
jgi:hypothetical protein